MKNTEHIEFLQKKSKKIYKKFKSLNHNSLSKIEIDILKKDIQELYELLCNSEKFESQNFPEKENILPQKKKNQEEKKKHKFPKPIIPEKEKIDDFDLVEDNEKEQIIEDEKLSDTSQPERKKTEVVPEINEEDIISEERNTIEATEKTEIPETEAITEIEEKPSKTEIQEKEIKTEKQEKPEIPKDYIEEKPSAKKTENKELVADKFKKEKVLLEKISGNNKKNDLAEKIKLKPLENIKDGISLNDKIWFIKELVDGNTTLFNNLIKEVNSAENLASAMIVLKEKTNKTEENRAFQKFTKLISRRFQ